MLTLNYIEDTNILEFTFYGGMSHEDFDRIAAKIDMLLKKYVKIRLIEIIRNVGHVEPAAIWKDMKFTPRHLDSFSHIAIVADQKWVGWLTIIAKPLISAEVRTFQLDQIERARHWIHST